MGITNLRHSLQKRYSALTGELEDIHLSIEREPFCHHCGCAVAYRITRAVKTARLESSGSAASSNA
ncbi:hypothetical protein [Sphingomonas sp.]|uniref:hypothetical protein n=1 Tax=Sphingomonas sp. TaxID=28214 RepID=UPI002EDB6EE8